MCACACDSYGQHVTTHDVVTGAMTHSFTYNVNSDYARLLRVSHVSAGVSVVVKRDYRLHAQQLTTMATPGALQRLSQSQRQLRCRVTTDSNGLLASLTTASSVTTRLRYVRDTGLLVSRVSAGLQTARVYEYSADGRVTSVTWSSGRQCSVSTSGVDNSHHHSDIHSSKTATR